MTRLVIFGHGEIAELAHYYFSTDSAYLVEGFTVDAEFLETESFCGLPLVPFEELSQSHPAEEFDLFIFIKFVNEILTVLSRAIQVAVFNSLLIHPVAHNTKHGSELTEHEGAVTRVLEFPHKFLEKLEFRGFNLFAFEFLRQ